jgi:hypothetical protein
MRTPLVALLLAAGLVSAAAQQTAPAEKLLFLTHAGLYKHTSLGPAEVAVTELGKQGGFDVTTVQGYTQDADKIDLAFLTGERSARAARSTPRSDIATTSGRMIRFSGRTFLVGSGGR